MQRVEAVCTTSTFLGGVTYFMWKLETVVSAAATTVRTGVRPAVLK